MKYVLLCLLICFSNSVYCKEWKNLKTYQKSTLKIHLSASDWLKSDRKQNTLVWQRANIYNLNGNLPEEYTSIIQRRDFYQWIYNELNNKGHEVVWPAMAHYISNKLRLVNTFPLNLLIREKIKNYSYQGSEVVFNSAFQTLRGLLNSQSILKGEAAIKWDSNLLKLEQFDWLATIYSTIDERGLKTISRIAKGKFLYAFVLPKKLRFRGDISKAESRYNYAFLILRTYCKKSRRYKFKT